jgi:hypothetical protein
MRRALLALALGASLPIGAAPIAAAPACAAGTTAAVHVIFPGDREVAECVEIEPGVTTGVDALRATGLPLVTEEYAGSGSLVCAISGVGSAFPREACIPPCPNGRCLFWAYLTRSSGGPWTFSSIGASTRTLAAGDEDAWVFGTHTTSSVDRIPPMRADVCGRGVSATAGAATGDGFPLAGVAPFGAAAVFGVAALRRMRRRA